MDDDADEKKEMIKENEQNNNQHDNDDTQKIKNIRKTKDEESVIWKIGTWNIRSITGKEKELEKEFEELEIDILAITETKKKAQGIIKTENGHIMLESMVRKNTGNRDEGKEQNENNNSGIRAKRRRHSDQ
ncbi:hypothetical protein QE152_g27802 [Popillia japonica]|uniref:Uncharacterized protein n=1 Tax=Popillia japonica TaxID=7064 RepID=A0AAW1JKK7_POPJA